MLSHFTFENKTINCVHEDKGMYVFDKIDQNKGVKIPGELCKNSLALFVTYKNMSEEWQQGLCGF